MISDPFERWALTPVINACGTMTDLGASRVHEGVRAVVDGILGSHVGMDELQSRAGAVIARATGAQAGCVAGCSAAAMTQVVAACMTGTDLALIEALPAFQGERRVLLPMGHMVNFGAPVDQTIRLAGAEVVAVGTADACEVWHMRAALEGGAAAAMYVVSHHTVRRNELPLDVFIGLCREHEVPAIVDMASEYDLKGPISMGAAAVIYSGHKFLSGTTSGIVAGGSSIVRATYLQRRGIGRTMKAGKESVVGAMAALERWERRDHNAARRAENERLELWMRELADVQGFSLAAHDDWTGNPITRLRITVSPADAGFNAWELVSRLWARSPRIAVRDDMVGRQEIYLDPCCLTSGEASQVAAAIRMEADRFRDSGDGCAVNWSDAKRSRRDAVCSWSGDGDAA